MFYHGARMSTTSVDVPYGLTAKQVVKNQLVEGLIVALGNHLVGLVLVEGPGSTRRSVPISAAISMDWSDLTRA